jgi:hypothetical protein
LLLYVEDKDEERAEDGGASVQGQVAVKICAKVADDKTSDAEDSGYPLNRGLILVSVGVKSSIL